MRRRDGGDGRRRTAGMARLPFAARSDTPAPAGREATTSRAWRASDPYILGFALRARSGSTSRRRRFPMASSGEAATPLLKSATPSPQAPLSKRASMMTAGFHPPAAIIAQELQRVGERVDPATSVRRLCGLLPSRSCTCACSHNPVSLP